MPIAFELSEKKAVKLNNAKLASLKTKPLEWFIRDSDLEAHTVNIFFFNVSCRQKQMKVQMGKFTGN